jgi:phosphoglucomutase
VEANERAGQPATDADLVDVAALVTAYYSEHPDPAEPGQQVAFGTSGHRGSAFRLSFNEDHIAATTQAICEYRARAASPARCTWAGTPTRCPSPPSSPRWRCSPPTRRAC